jgi:hypothetical protein
MKTEQDSQILPTMNKAGVSISELDPSSASSMGIRQRIQQAFWQRQHRGDRLAPAPTATKTTSILDLPTELIVIIFELLLRAQNFNSEDLCSIICLALASRRLYAILKSCFPNPIRLPLILSTYDLPLLRFENWLGPKYRLAYIPQDNGWREPVFLHKDIYGSDERGNADIMARWYFYRELWYVEGTYVRNVRYNPSELRTKVHILPRPAGLGSSWYKEAEEAIERTDWEMVKDVVGEDYWREMQRWKNIALRHAREYKEGRFMSFLRVKGFVIGALGGILETRWNRRR